MRKHIAAGAIVLWAVAGQVVAKGDPAAGLEKSEVCVACHNVDGNSSTPQWPKIAGQHEAYLLTQLKAFRDGTEGGRNNPVMYGIVGQMTDEDFADLSAYYAAQEMSAGEADPDLVAIGEELYRGGNLASGVTACIACHGPAGEGNALAGYPRVAGQMPEYMHDQLKAFQSGQRSNDMAGIMRMIASRMTDQEMKAVSSYMSGLHERD